MSGGRPRVRFEDAVDLHGSGGCWLWRAGKFPSGYGCLSGLDGRVRPAHLRFYEAFVGPVPDGLELDHLCRVRGCVNPDHLEPVTRAVNAQRGSTTRLTPEQVQEIRESTGPSEVVARSYGVSGRQVRRIRRGACWSES